LFILIYCSTIVPPNWFYISYYRSFCGSANHLNDSFFDPDPHAVELYVVATISSGLTAYSIPSLQMPADSLTICCMVVF